MIEEIDAEIVQSMDSGQGFAHVFLFFYPSYDDFRPEEISVPGFLISDGIAHLRLLVGRLDLSKLANLHTVPYLKSVRAASPLMGNQSRVN